MAGGRAAATPILSLYRSIVRLHRDKLAGPMRDLGDDYVRSEFRSHLRGKTTQLQWKEFVDQWQTYRAFLSGRGGAKAPMVQTSGELSPEVLEMMSDDQRKRMDMLREEARRLGKPEEEAR